MKWKQRLRDAVKIANDLSGILIHLREKPRATDFAALGLRFVNASVEHYDRMRGEYFRDWEELHLWEFSSYLFEIAKTNFDYEVVREQQHYTEYVTDIHGQKIGWHCESNSVFGPYVVKGNRDEAMSAMGRMVWEHLGTNSCSISKKKGQGSETIIIPDHSSSQIYSSEAAQSILERTDLFLRAGHNRSVMLYGVPGTGKSMAMRYIAKEVGRFTLRINVSDMANLSSEDMIFAIELLKPDTLLIDDFDRVERPDQFLLELEKINAHIKLLLVSVNHIERLGPAIIRPGRFDDIIKFEKVDQIIFDRLIGDDVPLDVRERLYKLPIAYIAEFHKRKQVLGVEKAIEEIVELESRIKEIVGNTPEPQPEEEDEDYMGDEEDGIEFEIRTR